MAVEFGGMDITCVAGADLSAWKYCAVNLDSSGKVVAPTDGGICLGILQNAPNADGQVAKVRVLGTSKARAHAALAAGAELQSYSNGRLYTASTGDFRIGRALEAAGADGDIIRVFITHDWPIT